MKKTYISPNTLLYAVIAERKLLAGSGEQGTKVYDGTNADSGKDVLSRRDFNVWDDEEDEE